MFYHQCCYSSPSPSALPVSPNIWVLLRFKLLNNNHITRLENGSFTGLRDLRYLYLYKNRIRLIESRVFQHLDKLEQLYLHFNDLATFDADTFSNLTSLERLKREFPEDALPAPPQTPPEGNLTHLPSPLPLLQVPAQHRLQRVPDGAFRNLHSLRRLRLDSNALVCDCQLLWLAEMVKEKQHRTQVAATCQFPSDLQGKSLTSLADSHFECRASFDPCPCSPPSLVFLLPPPPSSPPSSSNYPSRPPGGPYNRLAPPTPSLLLLFPLPPPPKKGGPPLLKEGRRLDAQFVGTALLYVQGRGHLLHHLSPLSAPPHPPHPDSNEVITADDRYNILTDGTLMIENTQDGDVGFYECMASNPMGEVKSRKAKMVHPEQQQQLQQYLQHQLRQQLHQQLRERQQQQQQQQPRERQVQQPEQQPQQERQQQERQQQERQQQPQQERQQERQQQQQQQGHHHGQHPGSQSQQAESTNQAIVPAKPRFVRLPSEVNVTVGSPVQMECEVTGRPRPDITWSRGDDLVEEGPRIQISNRGALTISSAVPSDAATYLCTAANHLGRVTASAALRVLVPPRLTGEPDDQYASPGSSVQFTCQAAGVPVPIISWSRNGLPIAPSREYVCRAQNPAGSVERRALYVREKYVPFLMSSLAYLSTPTPSSNTHPFQKEKVAPVIRQEPRDVVASEGQDAVTMPCRADGRPKPLIAWRKDGQLLRDDGEKYRIETDGALLVHNVTTDDAGLYECNAQNHVGFATARARLTVQEEEKPHLGDPFLQQSFDEAREQVDRAVNDTISQLFRRDRSRAPQPHELLRIFRFPSNEGREIARATEMIEQTLQIVMRHVESGMLFNLTSFSYQDLLSPEKVVLLTNLSGCLAHRRNVYCDDMCFHTKYRSDDGTCNNLRHPLWGASLTGFRRVLNPIYENGFNTPVGWSKTKRYHGFFKPSARLVSTRVISTEDVSPDHHCTHMLMQWGQFLDHDIDHALPSVSSESFHDGVSCQRSCDYAPPCFPIEIPPDDPRIRHHRCMEFTRSSGICGSGMTSVFYDTVLPREQINQLTSFIDGSQVYGSSSAEVRLLRNLTHNHGQLRHGIFMSGKPMMPFSNGAPVDCRRDVTESGIDCFLAGDIRANEQSGLTAMHNIWFREHNRVARALREINPGWDGDTIYYESRKIVGAEMQHITYQHWMQHILGPRGMEMLGEYSGYNSNINPTISNVFATAAYR
ncbi:putative Thyroid peroxidase precursor [Penaeus vannamei]|uniref:Putative Thyroid peroxidase n=1 Tax=Penaeus vannamei TaxID=6689 RepID=A0A423TH65_PENVA|nr:putative Thyroid peroxidase precursor [Penaeus vannamei]